ncbi:MAG: dihydrolipoyllysine-residue acetyltransferase [Gammaproteobacteria bacterium]|nr:dihydrolipoyllysine-residue acetyltransferase [Gammaproteobacteria bacterium]MDH5302840.1 dihydrolipoyllysine-residue acetyltransferase [Gammaproteobacteria bacterium]MDH5323068.1 dihydrolipoyllysine-residue acetyltransferase [Gammaproteobacteria bacterium]
MSQSIDIVVPDLGDFADVEVIEILVAPGDTVERETGLITLETDKAAMDVPSPEHGVIVEISVAVGDRVSSGDVIGKLSIEVSDTVVITPMLLHEATGDTTVLASPARAEGEVQKSGGVQTLVVPDLGDFENVEVIEVHIAKGDELNVEDPLVTLETDKAAMDVPAIVGGRIESVLVKVGDKVSQGSSLAIIKARSGPAVTPASKVAEKVTAPPVPTPAPAVSAASATAGPASPVRTAATLPPINEAGFSRAHASPSVRKLARELGVDLVRVNGTGHKNRILHDDVKAFVKAILTGQAGGVAAALPKTPLVDFAKFGEIELVPLTRIQKISGPRLQASWLNIPHVTQHDLADITELETKRQQLKGAARERGISLTPLAFVLKACVAALQEFPKVNASLADDGKNLVFKKYCHLGFAADTEQGLMVPVIRDADKKSVYQLAQELAQLSQAARDGKLKSDQLQGATFTVSSLGGIGGTAFTPIVNAPEVAILGVSRSSMQPAWNGTEFVPRLMLPLSLSYDHRVVDGAAAVRFTTFLGQVLADVDGLLKGSEK